ncbi:hypothetical protein Ctob_014623 [Chrysochromulina tobinii]|uniref:Uncharacterized protein n=1 Tax=Chrysochromulina tobinii TaxID=1460289 RepID=A0A0M0K7L1_9EUKA|nr:hypothetical protein Ctob_014623 [Chrysochromulina tobinii]|eukprot:KOO34856.1 hypothetical protein Ctob_014623 [Chrysochromulina sp. CCMP291]
MRERETISVSAATWGASTDDGVGRILTRLGHDGVLGKEGRRHVAERDVGFGQHMIERWQPVRKLSLELSEDGREAGVMELARKHRLLEDA